jgi:hypothetical protein
MKHLKKFEDVYWGKEDVLESDSERNERIQKWVENYVDEQVGLEIMSVSVSDKIISVKYKKGERFEDRQQGITNRHHTSGRSIEDMKKAMKDDWYQMALEMIEEMSHDSMSGYENALDLDLRDKDKRSIMTTENGYIITSYKPLPKIKTGERSSGFSGW